MMERINKDTYEYRPKTPEELERQRIFDQKVTQAIKTYTMNHPSADALLPRIEAIEKALAEKEAELQKTKLDNYLFKQCTKLGMPYDLLKDYSYTDEADIDTKLENLNKAFEMKRTADVNALLASGYKPQAGNEIRTEPKKTEDLSQQEAIMLESQNRLDEILRGR
jgi:hypothetical protein